MSQSDKVNRMVHLSYRDVLLVPYDDDFCKVKSRNDPDISTILCNNKRIQIPIIAAPMDAICGDEMCIALERVGAIGIHTRYINEEDEAGKQIQSIRQMKEARLKHIAVATGVKYHNILRLADEGADIICLDIANGNHMFMQSALKAVDDVKKVHSKLSIIAGNVASGEAAVRLSDHGADAVKVGIGPGAACTTRRVTGFGVPQFTAVMECAEALKSRSTTVIADGGIRNSGDVVKALWAGADSVMAGYIFAGCAECPTNGKRQYRGMSSRTVSGRSDIAPEGICMDVEDKGPVASVVQEYAAAIRAALSMGNAMRLHELRTNVRAIRVSTMSNEESDPVAG